MDGPWWLLAVWEGLLQGALLVLKLAAVVVPLLVGVEIARALGWLDALNRRLRPLTAGLGISEGLAPALSASTAAGLMLGSGLVLATTRRRGFGRRELTRLFLFAGIFHAMFEDTAVFTVLGANPLIVIGTRLVFAVAAVLVYRLLAPAPPSACARAGAPRRGYTR